MTYYPRFSTRFRGFDRTEVVAALAKLASENEDARREIDRLGAEIQRLQSSVSSSEPPPSGNERHVQVALMAAAKAADELRDRAEEEARQILRDAEERGEMVVKRLTEQVHGIEDEIDALLVRRRDVEASIESFIKALSEGLERARKQQANDAADGKLAQAK